MTRRSVELLRQRCGGESTLLTPSCTHALEMACRLLDLAPGDEVILPSFNFPSAATAVTLCGATPVFIDVDPLTKNLTYAGVQAALSERTRAVIVLHYAGVPADMEPLLSLSEGTGIALIEDAAHGLGVKTSLGILGSWASMSAYSFHETKNFQCGEGGALQINDARFVERAHILREKGTDRSRFFQGLVDKYSWVDTGSSWLLADPLAALLCGQLEQYEEIQSSRVGVWESYSAALSSWALGTGFGLPYLPPDTENAAHMFYLVAPDNASRSAFIRHLADRGVASAFHYQPLHSSRAGRAFGVASECPTSDALGQCLVRLPLYCAMPQETIERVCDAVLSFDR